MILSKNTKTKATLAIIGASLVYASVGIPVRVLATNITIFQQLYLWLIASLGFSYLLFRNRIRWHVYYHLSLHDSQVQ